MRDTSEGMIEFIKTLKSDDGYFLIISVTKKTDKKNFRFGVSPSTYKALRRILESRPLDKMPGLKYRYFWNGSMSKKTEKKICLGIRCEVGGNGKSIDFEVPHTLAANLKWFSQIETFDEAEHLCHSE